MRKVIIGIIIAVALILMVFAMGMCSSLFGSRRPFSGGGEIGLIKLEDMIVTADDFIERMEEARKDDGIKAILLRIDSPGGSVAASQEIFEEVKKVNAVKPVIASMGDVAASGGYYAACGARRIFANAGTITGSIGVRMEHMNIEELLKWAKVSHETFKSGKFKDIGAFDRQMTPEEREIVQGVLSNLHEQFKKAVAESRHLTKEQIDEIADGRVYSGEQALKLGLVDELGGLAVATAAAANAAGVKGEPSIRKIEHEKGLFYRLFSENADLLMEKIIGRTNTDSYKF